MDKLFETNKNIGEMKNRGGGMNPPSDSEDPNTLTNAERDELHKRLRGKTKVKLTLRMLVLGKEGTGKSGIVMSYLFKHNKRSMIIDLDGGMQKNLVHYSGAEDFIHVENPLQFGKDRKGRTVIDYVKTFETIKEIVKFVKENANEYDALVLDGVSTLYEFASKQVKIDKYITPEGDVNFKFWQIRNDYFGGVIETSRSINNIDVIFIGHDDMKLIPGKTKVTFKNGGVTMMDNTSKAIQKLHRMVDQKIWTDKVVDKKAKDGKKTSYTALYEKARPFLDLEEEEVVFSTKQGPNVVWTGETVIGAFDRSKKNENTN